MTLQPTAAPSALRIQDSSGAVDVVVSPLAASLRALTVDGVALVEPSDQSEDLVQMAGAVLVPWPNRVEDAQWWQDDIVHRLEMTEPELRTANHGLVSDRVFDVLGASADRVHLRTALRRPPGYPFELDTDVEYVATTDGVLVRTTLRNVGRSTAPVAVGAHPYLRFGATAPQTLRLRIDATHAYRLDERHLPRGVFPVAGSAADIRTPTAVPLTPEHITYVRVGGEHPLRHALTTVGGHGVELVADAPFRWTQLYRTPSFPDGDGVRAAVAVEPMTAPPNALRTGEGLRHLAPGEAWTVSWALRRLGGTRGCGLGTPTG